MRYGTCHFVSIQAAYNYYSVYGYGKLEVDQKLAEGDIKIGPPETKGGEKVVLDKTEGRYFIEMEEN